MGLLRDNHVFSYSQLSSFDECPYCFYLQKIEKTENIASNAFAEKGSLIHDLLDKWAKKELTKEQMISEYDRRYGEEVVTAFPSVMKGYAQKAYQSGREYLENFDEFAGYKVISAEEKFTIDLPLNDGTTRKFTGIVDMILRKEWTNELIICDHKSKSADAFKKAEKDMWKQQYLYAQYVCEQYGEWPASLMFNLFGDNGYKPEKPFSLQEFRDTLTWATSCIQKMEEYTILDWLTCKESSDFYCANLCGPRYECPKCFEKPLNKQEKEALRLRRQEVEQSEGMLEIPVINKESEQKNDDILSKEENNTGMICTGCGQPYVPGKRKCPNCKAWYKIRIK